MAMKKDACSLEKSYDQPRQYIKKQRHYFANKGPSSQNNVKVKAKKTPFFPGVRYGCESWTIKKSEHQRIDAFELWCWRRLLRIPWTVRRSNQLILKEISPEYSWKCSFISEYSFTDGEAPILWPPHAKNWLIGKYLDAGKD